MAENESVAKSVERSGGPKRGFVAEVVSNTVAALFLALVTIGFFAVMGCILRLILEAYRLGWGLFDWVTVWEPYGAVVPITFSIVVVVLLVYMYRIREIEKREEAVKHTHELMVQLDRSGEKETT